MSLRLKASLVLSLFALLPACKEVKQQAPGEAFVLAAFDPTTATIPTPNDLALQAAPALQGLQGELLRSFIASGGWPNDQETAISIPIRVLQRQADGSYAYATTAAALPAGIEPASVNAQSVAIVNVAKSPAEVIEPEFGGYAKSAVTPGLATLTIRRKAAADGSRRWDAGGRFVVALRAGAIKSTDGLPLNADKPIALVAPNKPLTVAENQPPFGALPAAQIPALEQLRNLYANPLVWTTVTSAPTCAAVGVPVAPCWLPLKPTQLPPPPPTTEAAFSAVDRVFPHDQIASIQTFVVAPATARTQVLTDAGSGQLPLPSDFLLDPATGKVRNIPAFGAAAAGLATLDGFSTTGLLLAPLSKPVRASTITSDTVLFYELNKATTPPSLTQVPDLRLAAATGATPQYLTEPPALVQSGATTAIGLQPAIPVPLPTSTIVYLPPLKEKTTYLVVITDGVQDVNGQPIVRSTLGNILFGFTSPLYDPTKPAGQQSQVPGLSDADAKGLATIQTLVRLAPGLTGKNPVMAYTVTTQTVTDVSVALSALPYGVEATAKQAVFTPSTAPATFDPATVGLPAGAVPGSKLLGATVPTLDVIDPATGALDPNLAKLSDPNVSAAEKGAYVQSHLKQIPALLAFPATRPTACPPAPAPCPLPLVVYHHGLNGGHLQMLTVADAFTSRGFIVAAIDAPYHGDRAFCSENAQCVTASGTEGTCTPDQARATEGDKIPPGTCTNGSTLKFGVNLAPVASGNYFISSNFFRIRDAFRQDLLDQSALILALARPPTASGYPQPPANPLASALGQAGYAVNPTAIYFEGLSLGGIAGTDVAATNPRVSRAVFSSPGGTLTDVFTNAPAFSSEVDQLFLGLGIDRSKIATDPAVAADYVQTLIVAKWILDPAEPINYAQHVTTKLASPLLAAPPAGFGGTGLVSARTDAYGQLSKCDQVVPNATTIVNGTPLAFGDLLLTLAGIRGESALYDTATSSTNPDGCVPHGVLNDTFNPQSIGATVRAEAADFLLTATPAATGLVTLP